MADSELFFGDRFMSSSQSGEIATYSVEPMAYLGAAIVLPSCYHSWWQCRQRMAFNRAFCPSWINHSSQDGKRPALGELPVSLIVLSTNEVLTCSIARLII